MRRPKQAEAKERRPATPRGAATRARIVEAAADLVYRRGRSGTSLDDIMAASATRSRSSTTTSPERMR